MDYSLTVSKDASAQEIALVTKLNSSLSDLSGYTKTDLLNQILSLLEYGQSMFEIVLKRDGSSQVFDTFSPIHPIDVNKYVYNRNVLKELVLNPSDNDGLLVQQTATEKKLNGAKVLQFKLNPSLDYPLGQSLLNRCYLPWKKKGIASEYELIGIAKNLSGVLKIKAPAEYIQAFYNEPTSTNAQYMTELINQAELTHAGKTSVCVVASDAQENGVALFDITTIGNADGNDMDVNEIIKRYDISILTTLYTDILALGQGGGGSFALSDSKTTILSLFIDSLLNAITSGFNKAVKASYEANGVVPKTDYAKLSFSEVEKLDFEAFSRGWQRLVQSGAVQADDKLEAYLRETAQAPEKDTATVRDTSTGGQDNNERNDKEK